MPVKVQFEDEHFIDCLVKLASCFGDPGNWLRSPQHLGCLSTCQRSLAVYFHPSPVLGLLTLLSETEPGNEAPFTCRIDLSSM